MRDAIVVLVLVLAGSAAAAERPSWDEYVKANRFVCPGPFDTLKTPRKLVLGGKAYLHSGYRLEVQNPDADDAIVVGVLSAMKDGTAATRENVKAALAWFKARGVEWIIANGDLATEEEDLEQVMRVLGGAGVPVLVFPGNNESRAAFSRVFQAVAPSAPNLVNGVLVRQIVADDLELWTVPGYYDKQYVYQGAGCSYGPSEADTVLAKLKPTGKAPVVLVSHGPPQGQGHAALDVIADGKNVGDHNLTRIIREAHIPFGIFGHILEAGGRAVGADLSSPVAAGTAVPALYVNAGSLSAEPWKMNDGTSSTGMAMLLSFAGGKASWELRRFGPQAR
jgi:hypothetical protein